MINVSNFKIFAVLPDEDDTFLQGFLDSAQNFVLRLAGLDSIPEKEGTPGEPDEEFKQAIFTYALFLYNSRDFVRPEIEKCTQQHVLNLIAGKANYSNRLVLTETE